MGAVYLAQHVSLGRQVALKLLLGPVDPDLRARFLREVEACSRLEHPNLVRVHDSGEAEGRLFLAMEFVRGYSLQELLERSGPLEPRQAVRGVLEAAAGVASAHAQGVLHRDLKPGNLLWDTDAGAVRVVDFGLTGRLAGGQSLTATGEVLGTPGFLAPEQAAGSPTDARTDVYGLGATLFALLCGRPPFQGAGLAALAAVFNEPAPELSTLRPDVDRPLSALVARCLEKEPRDRFESMAALESALVAWQAGEAPRHSPSRRLRGALGLALGLALAGGGVVAVTRWRDAARAQAAATLEGFAAWREEALEPWAFGLGGPEPGAELEGWVERLGAAEGSAEASAWAAAASEVRAARRVLAARGGADPGFPAEGGPPPREADWIAEGALALSGGDWERARDALGRVGPAGRERRGYRRCALRLEAEEHPTRLLRRLEGAAEVDPLALEDFPLALERAGRSEDSARLLAWTARARALGAPQPEAALRAALEAYAPRLKRDLETQPRPDGAAGLIRFLCTPLRAQGLWPGPAFAEVARGYFRRGAARPLATGGKIEAWYRYEHELFYRVDARYCTLPGWGAAIRAAWVRVPSALAVRTSARVGNFPGGLTGPYEFEQLLVQLAVAPEAQSRLERVLEWYARYGRPLAQAEVERCEGCVPELEEALAFGVDDLHPVVLVRVLNELAKIAHLDPARRVELGGFVRRLAIPAGEDCLRRQVADPSADFLSLRTTAVRVACVGAMQEGPPERALEVAQDALRGLREARGQAPELAQALSSAEARVYASTAANYHAYGLAKLALPALEGGAEVVLDHGDTRSRGDYFAWLAVARRQRDGLDKAIELLEQVEGRIEREWHALAFVAADVFEAAQRPEDARRWLRRSLDAEHSSSGLKSSSLERAACAARLAALEAKAR